MPAPIYQLFDYLPPADVASEALQPGIRLRVPFGSGVCVAVLMEISDNAGIAPARLRRASAQIDRTPLLNSEDLALLRWTADYYQHPIGEVVANALPGLLRKGEMLPQAGEPGWRLTELGRDQDASMLTRAPRQAELLRLLQSVEGGMSRASIYHRQGACLPTLRRLEAQGWIVPERIVGGYVAAGDEGAESAFTLNADQQAAVRQVVDSRDRFGAFLLDGVTGSGKTEVYLTLIESVVEQGGQALVLVPEIGLTPQLMQRFARRLRAPMALLHSGLSDGARTRAWNSARTGVARVLVGTRSSIYTPLPDLKLVVVDEEHDLALKQQDGVRYSARDIAVMRAQRRHCPVLLGSATPSFETLHNVDEGRYRLLHLAQRAGGASTPRIDLLDIRSARLEAGVSPVLQREIRRELRAGHQVLLFLNRRGYAPVLTCHDCGWLAQCRRCDARMTVHMADDRLTCHHCGAQQSVVHTCPECGSDALRTLGQGTEQLESMLRERYAEVGIIRIDRDATRRRGSLERSLQEIREGKYSLLLGTQMLAKGHHFPNVTLVGILDLDQGLFGADYRSAERMAQQLVQVSGRAGRAEKPGRVLVQTRHPDHPLLQLLLRSGYGAFARASLNERRAAQLPPFNYQALLRAEAHQPEPVVSFLEHCAAEVANSDAGETVEVWGPVTAPMERRAGRYRYQLLLQAVHRQQLRRLLTLWVPEVARLKSARRVRWSIDVDPQEMY